MAGCAEGPHRCHRCLSLLAPAAARAAEPGAEVSALQKGCGERLPLTAKGHFAPGNIGDGGNTAPPARLIPSPFPTPLSLLQVMPKPRWRPWPGTVPGHPSCCSSPCSCSCARVVSGVCPVPQLHTRCHPRAPLACPQRRGTPGLCRHHGAGRMGPGASWQPCPTPSSSSPAAGGPSKGRGTHPSVLALSQQCRGSDTSFLPAGTLGCASVAVASPIVALGSAVRASCTVRSELCRGLEQGKVRITWMLDNEPMAGSQHRGAGGSEVSNLTLPQFNRTQARLWCWVEWNGTKQRVGMAEIRAGCKSAAATGHHCVHKRRNLALGSCVSSLRRMSALGKATAVADG